MRITKRAMIFSALLLAVVLGAIGWEIGRPQERLAHGKPLKFWLDQHRFNRPGDGQDRMAMQSEAEEAIRQLGTNSIPQLLRMLLEHDSNVKTKLLEILEKQKLIRVDYETACERNLEAVDGFGILGADAKQAVPSLIDIFEHSPSAWSRTVSADALAAIGLAARAAIPALLRGTTNSDVGVRVSAVAAFRTLRPAPATGVPALMRCLGDPSADVRVFAAEVLGMYGSEAEQAIPPLTQLRGDSEREVQLSAERALKQIEHSAPSEGNR